MDFQAFLWKMMVSYNNHMFKLYKLGNIKCRLSALYVIKILIIIKTYATYVQFTPSCSN